MDSLTSLASRLLAIRSALDAAAVPHAFGGAVALAYALEEPRGTRDLDVNVFVSSEDVARVLDALPRGVRHTAADVDQVARDDQVRLWWDETPVDLFFAADDFHYQVARRTREVPFAETTIRVLDPGDLAVFKVLFDRRKDWQDLWMMWESGTLDIPVVSRQLIHLLGDDPRIGRLQQIGRE